MLINAASLGYLPTQAQNLPYNNFLYFMKKLHLKNFLYFGMKPDLTYYHNYLLTLKNLLYFIEETNIQSHFVTPSVK